MIFEIRFGVEAGATYSDLVAQLNERWGEKFVLKFESKVKKSLITIASNPYLYAIVLKEMQLRKCVLHKNCSILYTIIKDIVLVVAFWDNRQDALDGNT